MKYATPKVIWLVGCHCSEISNIAKSLQTLCRSRSIPAMVVDDAAYTPRELCQLVKSLAEQGYPVIVAAAQSVHDVHVWNRVNLPGYFEVHFASPQETLQQRPVAPDLRVHTGNIAEGAGQHDLAEDIFEEVFGRGQLMPEAKKRTLLPPSGYQSMLRAG